METGEYIGFCTDKMAYRVLVGSPEDPYGWSSHGAETSGRNVLNLSCAARYVIVHGYFS